MPWQTEVRRARFWVPDMSDDGQLEPAHRLYWQRTVSLTLRLLCVWLVLTFALIFFARDLQFQFFGWPFGFWAAAQGVLLVYLGLIAFYAFAMNRLDAAHGSAQAVVDD
jgi:putative solute:sodium symporter small subunit